MPPQSILVSRGDGLCLLSLDAGGSRGISQIKILAELMHRLNFGSETHEVGRPCSVFNMIGGVGSGGFIAILLVVFGLSAEETMNEVIELSVSIFGMQGVDANARTTALRSHIDILLLKYGIDKEMRLLDANARSRGCKLIVPIYYKKTIGSPCFLRNFDVSQELPLNLTIAEALLVTLASPPLFTSTSISKDAAIYDFVSGDISLSNPVREVLSDAHEAFGPGERVAYILSLGCGHPGVFSVPESSDLDNLNQFLEKLVTDSEEKAQCIDVQMGHLGLYGRFCVTRGLDNNTKTITQTPGDILTHTATYLTDISLSRKMDDCVNSLKLRDGVSSLSQLKYSGGQTVLPPSLPPLTRTFVMRKKPWEFVEKTMFGAVESTEADGQRLLVVTGIGGCGKTQLIIKFMLTHANKFVSSFFIDGSSEPRIRADIIRNVRSLSVAHSQMTFEDCLLFLAQPSPDGHRVVVYDNVDDPDLDLAPLLPYGKGCAIIITSRNHSIGGMCEDAHLELDEMSMDEAVELLLYTPNRFDPFTERARQDAHAIAEALGCLPIALAQARSYMYQTKCSGSAYLELLLSSRDELLALPVKYQREMRYLSTYAAFNASFQRLTLRDQRLLRLLSHFHWSKFPLELIILAAKYGFSEYAKKYTDEAEEFFTSKAMLEDIFLRSGRWSAMYLNEMTTSLQNYSLVTLSSGVDTVLLQMHPLAHGWVRSSIPEDELPGYQSTSVLLLAFGARGHHTPSAQYFASHVNHMSSLWDQLHVNDAGAFGSILYTAGSFNLALQLQERVVAELRNPAHQDATLPSQALRSLAPALTRPNVIPFSHALRSLALTFSRLGRFKEAMAIQEEVLDLRKSTLGIGHPETIAILNDLATTYYDLGQLQEARTRQEEVWKLRKELLGDSHPDTISASSNLANTFRDLGRLKEAKALQEEVLKLRKEKLGPRHPDTLSASSNLANTYYDMGRFTDAEALEVEVLAQRKAIIGDHHPDTISASINLAATYSELGRLDEAEVLETEVLRRREELLGERHPDTITASSNLAITYRALGRPGDAKVLQEKVLKLRTEILGKDHPDTRKADANLKETRRVSEAPMQREKERFHPLPFWGVDDPLSRWEQRNLEQRISIQEGVLASKEMTYGKRSIEAIDASEALALLYQKLCPYTTARWDSVLELLDGALQLREEIQGKQHLRTMITKRWLAAARMSRLSARQDELERRHITVERYISSPDADIPDPAYLMKVIKAKYPEHLWKDDVLSEPAATPISETDQEPRSSDMSLTDSLRWFLQGRGTTNV